MAKVKREKSCADRLVLVFGRDRGAMTAAARALGTYHTMVSNWRIRGYIPPSWALKVEQATSGKITMQEILEEYERKFPKKATPTAFMAG